MTRPTRALINLEAVRHNYRLAQALAPNSQALGVVKANAYGCGAVPVAQALEPLAPAFAVACLEEALELRQAGLQKPILLLEGPFEADEITTAVDNDCWLMIASLEQVPMLEQLCRQQSLFKPLTLWLKVDTGMHRLGIPLSDAADAYQRLQLLTTNPVVLATHFAIADEIARDITQQQIQRLQQLNQQLPTAAPLSLANSAGVLAWPQSHGQYIRPGIMLYGSSPFAFDADIGTDSLQQIRHKDIRPVMTLESRIIALRDIDAGEAVGYGQRWTAQTPSRIATVAVGYGDGYPRHAPNGTPVSIRGQRCPLAGRVSMDMITVDVTALQEVAVGDRVELWGEAISIDEIAMRSGTIGYELMTRMPMRAKRHYLN